MEQKQVNKQVQKLLLSQEMRQSVHILQCDSVNLTSYLKERSLDNPFLEVRSHFSATSRVATPREGTQLKGPRFNSVEEYLLQQVSLSMRESHLKELVVAFIDLLDDRGYFPYSISEIANDTNLDPVELTDALTLLQQLDPPGIGARNLRECLILQAQANMTPPTLALRILEHYFSQLVDHSWVTIAHDTGHSQKEIAEAVAFIKRLSPTPAIPNLTNTVEYIYPDLTLQIDNHQFQLSINHANEPELVFSAKSFSEFEKNTNMTVQTYLREKKAEYSDLQAELIHREETLLAIGSQIINEQLEHLINPSVPLKPLLQRQIAARLKLSESVISRGILGKYVQTQNGVIALKDLLSHRSAMTVDAKSDDEVKHAIISLIHNESKNRPYSDQKLCSLLANTGIVVSRRTVAKYRMQLGIPSTNTRKQSRLTQ